MSMNISGLGNTYNGINTNSKQYKTVISKMMQNANGMMYTNPAAIKNLMKNYDKDGD